MTEFERAALERLDISHATYTVQCTYFTALTIEAIDGTEDEAKAAYDKAQKFVREARDYKRVIDGVRLFRPK